MLKQIKRKKKYVVREQVDEETRSKITDKVERLVLMGTASYHCEGGCGDGCGNEAGGACPPC